MQSFTKSIPVDVVSVARRFVTQFSYLWLFRSHAFKPLKQLSEQQIQWTEITALTTFRAPAIIKHRKSHKLLVAQATSHQALCVQSPTDHSFSSKIKREKSRLPDKIEGAASERMLEGGVTRCYNRVTNAESLLRRSHEMTTIDSHFTMSSTQSLATSSSDSTRLAYTQHFTRSVSSY